MTAELKIKAIAPWFGGKRTMAPDIVKELGLHTQYFEPFCGSMAVLFAKDPSRAETVNDLHGDLINLAEIIQEESSAMQIYERLQRTLFSEGLLDNSRVMLDRLPPWDVSPGYRDAGQRAKMIDRAYWYFLASWMGRNGTAGTDRNNYQLAVRWTKGGGSPTVRWRNTVESIPAWHRRLLNVVILNRDAFRILDRFEDVADTAIYVDPPYPAETRGKIKNGRGGKYLHEFNHSAGGMFEEPDDHARLAEILREYRKARIVLSSYDCERIRKLYDGWTFVEKTRQKNLHVQNKRGAGKTEAPEVLILNGPSYSYKGIE